MKDFLAVVGDGAFCGSEGGYTVGVTELPHRYQGGGSQGREEVGFPGCWWEQGDGELRGMGGVHELLVGQLDWDGVQSWSGVGQCGFR